MGEGEMSDWLRDIEIAVENNLPIIIVKGSEVCEKMIEYLG